MLQLCAAQLLNCGVLMRVEPTGHLDVVNISVFVVHEIEDEEVGVQDDGFPILSVGKSHTCKASHKLVPPVTEEQCMELMRSTGLGYPAARTVRRTWSRLSRAIPAAGS